MPWASRKLHTVNPNSMNCTQVREAETVGRLAAAGWADNAKGLSLRHLGAWHLALVCCPSNFGANLVLARARRPASMLTLSKR